MALGHNPTAVPVNLLRGDGLSVVFEFVDEADAPIDVSGRQWEMPVAVDPGGTPSVSFEVVDGDESNRIVATITGEQIGGLAESAYRFWLKDLTSEWTVLDGPVTVKDRGKAGVVLESGARDTVTVRRSDHVVIRATVVAAPEGDGVTDHRLLTHRDAPDQHPIEAISGRNAPGGYPGLTEAGLILENQIPASITRDSEVAELARDAVGGAMVGGDGVDVTVDDGADSITVAVDGTVVRDDDGRLADARTPTAHASSHASGGSDELTPAAIGAASTGDLAGKADASALNAKLDTTGGGKDVVYALGNISGAVEVDFADGNVQTATLVGNVTDLSFTGATVGRGCQLMLVVAGDYSVVWDAAVDWGDAGPPTLSETGVDRLVFATEDGGETVAAAVMGLGYSP